MTHPNSFGSRSTLDVAGRQYTIFRLDSLSKLANGSADRLPFSLKILLENLLRNEDGKFVKAEDIRALATWDVKGTLEKEIAFRTARVLLRISPEFPLWSISPRCVTHWLAWAATRG